MGDARDCRALRLRGKLGSEMRIAINTFAAVATPGLAAAPPALLAPVAALTRIVERHGAITGRGGEVALHAAMLAGSTLCFFRITRRRLARSG